MNPETTVVYRCGRCGSISEQETAAASCCVCPKCKRRPVELRRIGDRWDRYSACPVCGAKQRLRYAQEREREAVKSLAYAKKNLAEAKDEFAKLRVQS
jgi:DNA-directed RNA polymerase subunit RPC12/RpoP